MTPDPIAIEIKANADSFVDTCRIIAKHLTALANDLEAVEHGTPKDQIERGIDYINRTYGSEA